MSECPCKSCGYELEVGDVTCGACGAECDPDEANGFKIERKVTRGNTLVLEVRAQNPFTKGAPNSASAGFKARVTIRQNLGDKIPEFVGSFDLGDVVDAGGGTFQIVVPSTVTYAFADGVTKLYYDVQFVENGKTWTQEKGLVRVMPGVASYFDPETPVRSTEHADHDSKVAEALATGLDDVELFAWAGTLANGQGVKLELSIFALKDDALQADSWTLVAYYRKYGGTIFLENQIVQHQGSTAWSVSADGASPRIIAHSAPGANVRFVARANTMLIRA